MPFPKDQDLLPAFENFDLWSAGLPENRRALVENHFKFTAPEDLEEERKHFLSVALISQRTGRDAEEVSRNLETLYIPSFAKDVRGLNMAFPPKDAGEFYQQARSKLIDEKDERETFGEGSMAAFRGDDVIPALQAWQAKNGLERMAKSTAFTKGFLGAREWAGDQLEFASNLLGQIESNTGLTKGEGEQRPKAASRESAAEFEQSLATLADMQPEDRKKVYAIIAAKAEAAGYDPKGFWAQMLSEFSKGMARAGDTVSTSGADLLAGGSMVGGDAAGGFAPVPADSQERFQQGMEKRGKRGVIFAEIENLVAGTVDPVKPVLGWMNDTVERGLIKGPGAVAPFMMASAALGPYGAGVLFTADFAEQNRRDLVISGMDEGQARVIGMAAAPLQAVTESLSNALQLGRFPAVQKVLAGFTKPIGGGAGLITRYVQNSAISLGTEFTEEQLQDNFIVPATQELLGALQTDVPDVDWSMYRNRVIESTPELLSVLAPMALVFGGTMTAAQANLSAVAISSQDMLEAAGFSSAQANTIRSETAPEAQIAKARELWGQRAGTAKSIEDAAKSVGERMKQLQTDHMAAQLDMERRGILPRMLRSSEDNWRLTFSDGSTADFHTHQDADAARWQWATDQLGKVHLATREALAQMEKNAAVGREFAVEFKPDAMTAKQAVEEGRATPAQIERRIAQGEAAGEVSEEETFSNAASIDKATSDYLSSLQILGSSANEFKDGVLRTTIRLYEGAHVLTLVEEKLEGDAKQILASKPGSEWMLRSLRNYEQISGDSILRKVPDSELTQDDLIEAWSSLGQSYLVGKSKKGAAIGKGGARRIFADVLKAGMGGAMNSETQFFNAVWRRAAKLSKLKREGKLGEDLTAELERQLGIDSQTAHEAAVADGVASEIASYSEANPGPNGETFSMTNEHSPGGLSEAEVNASIFRQLPSIPAGKFALVKVTKLSAKRGTDVVRHPDGGFVAIVPASSIKWGSWERTKFRAFQKAAWPFQNNVFVRVSNSADDLKHLKNGTHRGSINHATGEAENGLSVSHSPEIPAKYAYLVQGDVVGEGTDGEPLINPQTAKVIGSTKTYNATQAKIKAAQEAMGLDENTIYNIAYSRPIAEIEVESADFVNPESSRAAGGTTFSMTNEPSPGGLSEAERLNILSQVTKEQQRLEKKTGLDDVDEREEMGREETSRLEEWLEEQIKHEAVNLTLRKLGAQLDGFSNKSEASYWSLPNQSSDFRIRVASHDAVYSISDTAVKIDLREITSVEDAIDEAISAVAGLQKQIAAALANDGDVTQEQNNHTASVSGMDTRLGGQTPPSAPEVNPESSRAAGGTFSLRKFPLPPGLAEAAQKARGESSLILAYQAAQRGSSSAMVPIRSVYEQAKKYQPALTPAQFMAEVNALNDSGKILVGLSETMKAVEAAGEFRVGGAGTEMAIPQETFSVRVTPAQDADYLAAVQAGDMEKAQRMVDEAAKAAGYDREAFKAMPEKDWRTDEPINVVKSTNGPWAGFFTDTKDVADKFGRIMRQPVRRAFLKLTKPFEVDASGKAAGELQFDILDDSGAYTQKNNAEILTAINSGSYDSIVLKNTVDEGTVIVPLNPSQIKSANPVTHDEQGNVIPLSQRFNPSRDEITYSLRSGDFSSRMAAAFSPFQRSPELRRLMGKLAHDRVMLEIPKIQEILGAQKAVLQALAENEITHAEDVAKLRERLEADEAQIRQDRDFELEALKQDKGTPLDREKILREADNSLKKRRIEFERDLRELNDKQAKDEAKNTKGLTAIDRQKMKETIRVLDAILSAVPPEVRPRVGGYARVPELDTDAKTMNFIENRIAKLDKELSKWLKKEYLEQIAKLFKRFAPKKDDKGRITSSITAEAAEDIGFAFEFASLDDANQEKEMAALEKTLEESEDAAEIQDAIGKLAIANLFHKLEEREASELEAAALWLEELGSGAREARKIIDAARAEWVKEAKDAAKADAANGRLSSLPDAENVEADARSSTFKRFTNDVKGFLNSALFTIGQQLELVFGQDSRITTEFHRRAVRAANDSTDIKRDIETRRADFVAKLFGTTSRIKQAGRMGALTVPTASGVVIATGGKTKIVDVPAEIIERIVEGTADLKALGLTTAEAATLADAWADSKALPANRRKRVFQVERQSKGKDVELTMSQDDAIQYLLWSKQKASREQMERDGWSKESFEQLDSFLSDDARALAGFFADEYARIGRLIEPVYRRMFHAPFPQVRNYSPIFRDISGADSIIDIDQQGHGSGVSSGFILARNKNARSAMRRTSAISAFMQHAQSAAHWISHVELVRDLRSVLTDKEVQNAIRSSGRTAAANGIKKRVMQLENQGKVGAAGIAELDSWGSRLLQARAFKGLAWRISPVMKQTSAFFNPLLSDVPAWDYMRGTARLLSGELNVAAMWQRPEIQRRIIGGFSAEARIAMDRLGYTGSTMLAAMGKGMMPMALVDAAWTTAGAAIAFDYYRRNNIKSGMNETQAESAALDQIEMMIAESAQPADPANRSLIEGLQNPWLKSMWMFASESRKNLAVEIMALRRLATGKSKNKALDLQRAVVAHVVMGATTQLMAGILSLLMGDDDDKEREWSVEEWASAIVAGPINGLFLFGDAFNYIGRRLFGLHAFEPSTAIGQAIKTVSYAPDNLDKVINGDPEEQRKAFLRLSEAVGQAAALVGPGNPFTAADVILGNPLRDLAKALGD